MIKQYIKTAAFSILSYALCFSLSGCSDDNTPFAIDDDGDKEVTLNLSIPEFLTQEMGSRAINENQLNDITLLGYNAGGSCVCHSSYSASSISVSGATATVRVYLPKSVTRVELAANASTLITGITGTPMSGIWNNANLASATTNVLWGRATVAELLNNNNTVQMLRQTAKVSVFETADNFEVTGFKVAGTATSGSIAPTLDGSGNPLLNPGSTNTAESAFTAAGSPVYVYETSENAPYIIVKGKFNGAESYYKLAFQTSTSNTRIPLQRNHYYKLTIKQVLGPGAATEAEAKAGDFSNRIIAQLMDHDEGIYKLIGGNDFALGVSNDLQLDAIATSAQAEVIVIAASPSQLVTPTVSAGADCSGWITSATITGGTATTVSGPNAKTYKLNLVLTQNNKSSNPRTGTLTITAGGLSQQVKVTQQGTDFKRDPSRKVTFAMGSVITSDYFSWLDSSVKGVTEEEMGVPRNQGFHFSTETDAASTYYLIPKLSGDVKSCSDSRIVVADNGSTWKVTIANGSTAATQTWVSQFTITNSAGAVIEYPVYRTGIFHNITTSTANTYQVSSEKYTGWFYYETVAVKGKSGKTYYILDRNIGASENGPFSRAVAALADHYETIGGYYKISNAKADNIKPQICPAGFTIPTSDEMTDIAFESRMFSTSTGKEYYSGCKTTDGSAIPTIYLPLGGYYEGENLKDANHALLWTSSYLSGAQGFSEGSPEYKYWFLHLDVYRSKVGLNNKRFVKGGGGQMGTEFKGMPIRCIRGDSSTPNAGGSGSGDVTPPTPGNNITIYYLDSDQQSAINVHYFDNGETTWPGISMSYVSGSVYKATVPAGTKLVFNNNGSVKYPSTGGFTAVDSHLYSLGGDEGAYNSGNNIYWCNTSKNFGTPYAYCWNGGSNNGWPGAAMTKLTSGKIYRYTVPSYCSGGGNVIFSNNGGNQTSDLELVINKCYK